MAYERLPGSVTTLYAELLDQAILASAAEAAGEAPSGSFVSKTIRGRRYWYLQRSEGERKRQIYLGPDSSSLARWIDQVKERRHTLEADRARLRQLCTMLTAGGATSEPAPVAKALRLLEEARIFSLGGVLVGTLAFRLSANVLGVRFDRSALRTQDIDVAHDPSIGVALAREAGPTNGLQALVESPLGFLPVPGLDPRRASTSFKVRGRDLRIDFLTPMRGRESSDPVSLPALRLSAHPVRHLGYLLDDTIQAVALGRDPVLVNLPDPSRLALHKLWASRLRTPAFRTKARKDLLQGGQLVEVLLEESPGPLAAAWHALPSSGSASRHVLAALGELGETLREHLLEAVE